MYVLKKARRAQRTSIYKSRNRMYVLKSSYYEEFLIIYKSRNRMYVLKSRFRSVKLKKDTNPASAETTFMLSRAKAKK